MEFIKNFEKCDCKAPLVIGVFKGEDICVEGFENIKTINANLDLGVVTCVYTFGCINNEKVYVIGKGEKEKYNDASVSRIFNKISKFKEEKVIIDLDSFGEDVALIAGYELVYGKYSFLECKGSDYKNNNQDMVVKFISKKDQNEMVSEGVKLATAVNNGRDLVNKPNNYLNATDLANYAKDLVEQFESDLVKCVIYDKKEIEEMKMGAFLGVNKGSVAEPKLIYLTYNGNKESDEYVGLIGKGLMFDTGGYSLKTNMVNMKCDMAGSATVLAAFEALVNNNIKCNVKVVIAATDNRINGEALLPDDVLTASNGKTIEIISTDAEGRLTLADALLFAQNEGCKEVIDVATLTGACVSALGEFITGLFGNDAKMKDAFKKSSEKSLEEVWELPINDYIRGKVRGSKVADLTNSTGPRMGASGAAAFLEAFINEGVKWIHLDIAGTAFHTAPLEYEYYGATGSMVKSIYNYIKG